jgi:hypothetical protein
VHKKNILWEWRGLSERATGSAARYCSRFQVYCYLNVTTVGIYKLGFQFIVVIKGKMSLQSRFRVDSPTYINQLCITDEFLVAPTSGGLVAILNTKCQHATPVLSKGECPHSGTLRVMVKPWLRPMMTA